MEIVVNKLRLKDLFSLAKIINKLDISQQKLPENFATLAPQEMALAAFDLLLGSLENVENDLYDFVSSVSNISRNDAPNIELYDIKTFIEKFIEVNDIEEVFTQAKKLQKMK